MNMDKEKWIIFSAIGVGIGLMLLGAYQYYEYQERKEAKRLAIEAKKAVPTPPTTNVKEGNQPAIVGKGLQNLTISDYVDYDITELLPYGSVNQVALFVKIRQEAESQSYKIKTCQVDDIPNSFEQTAVGVHLQAQKYYQAARQCYLFAAQKGNAYAANRLGELYLLGLGVKKDYAQAKLWLEQSANMGYYFAEVNLGLMYLDIPLTSKTLKLHPMAGILLSEDKLRYMKLGAKADLEQAQYWLSRAKRQNSPEGRILLQHFQLTLNTTPIDTAQKNIEIYSKDEKKTLLLKIPANNLPNRYPTTPREQAELRQISVYAEKLSKPPRNKLNELHKSRNHQSTGNSSIDMLF